MSDDLERQSVEQAEQLVDRAAEAQNILASFSQEKVDAIVAVMAKAALADAYRLAEMASAETGYGIPADKFQKNRFAAEDIYNFIKPIRTVGTIRETDSVIEVASPRGVVAAIIPSTNPTSTAIFKILIAVKARDAVVLSPHPSAINCICETARVMREAGEAAGLPAGAIGCMTSASLEGTQTLMKHKRTAVILATGGMGLVRAAYSSGKPAFGVGPGNVPAMIERSAIVPKAVKDILTGKCFDNGTICSSEQAVVVEREIEGKVREAFVKEGAYFLNVDEQQKLAAVVATEKNTLNSKIVGKSAKVIAEMAGIALPQGTRAMICQLEGVGKVFPLSMEKLSPILAYYVVDDLKNGCERAAQVLRFGGMGHTASIHTQDRSAAREYGEKMPVSRVIVNSPSTHGAIGFTTDLEPSMTLGCGSWGGNVTSDNISPRHLLDVKRIAFETKAINKADAAIPAMTTAVGKTASGAASARTESAVDNESISRLVDRFLEERRGAAQRLHQRPAPTPTPVIHSHPHTVVESKPSQPTVVTRPSSEPPRPAERTVATQPSTPESSNAENNGHVYDFVCEDDVKRAISERRKILVNNKTIITPAARDLGDAKEVLVKK